MCPVNSVLDLTLRPVGTGMCTMFCYAVIPRCRQTDRQTRLTNGPSSPGGEPTEVDPLWQRRMTTLLHVSRSREGPSTERKSRAVKDMEAWAGIYFSLPRVKEKKGEKEGFRETPGSGEEYCFLWLGALVPEMALKISPANQNLSC